MKSTKNTRAFSVGVFIFIALIIFVIGVLTLGGQQKAFASTVDVKAYFKDVNGLQGGSNIWFAGVKIGTIKNIEFTPAGEVEVVLGIEKSAQRYIHKNTKAKVGTDGLIGNKIVVLYGGSAQAPVVTNGDVLATENLFNVEDMMTTLQANNKNLLAITTDFKTISERLADGQGTIGKLLKDESLANSLQAAMATLQRTMNRAETAANAIAAYTAKLQQKGSLTNDLVTDTIIFSKLRSSVMQIESLSITATEVVNNLKQASQSVQTGVSSTNTPAGVLLHDEATAKSLKELIKNLQTSTQKLDENMEALQHNFLLRGFFKKRQKEQEKAQKDTAHLQ